MHAGQIPLLNEFLFSCRPQKWQKGGVFFLILFQHPKQMISSILALSVSLALQEIQTLGYIKSSKLFQKFPGIGVIISVKSVFVKKYCCCTKQHTGPSVPKGTHPAIIYAGVQIRPGVDAAVSD